MPGLRPTPSNSGSSFSSAYSDREMSTASLPQVLPSQRKGSSVPLGAMGPSSLEELRRLRGVELRTAQELHPGRAKEKKRKRRKSVITANLSGTRYEVVRQMVEKVGFSLSRDDDINAYLFWSDCFVSTDRVAELKSYQRLNHFPGMAEISRKDNLARNITKMQKSFPDEFNFVPRTWILPADHTALQNHAKDMRARKKIKTYIVKPANGAQGHGISLYRNAERIPPSEHFIVQEYIDKPLLMDGYKFDLRVYVLITSCDPLRIFLFNDGLVRLATEKYLPPLESNLSRLYMHLTNYSVNKHNEFYERDSSTDAGSKRSIRSFNQHLKSSDIDVVLLWRNIADMITKTLLVGEPHLLHAYRMCRPGVPSYSDSVCFEVLGFDIMIDRKLRPWLIEINRSPSFGTDEYLDFEIKSALIEDTFRLLNIKASDKRRNFAAQKAEAQKRLFRHNKKVEHSEVTEMDRKKLAIDKRREELRELLTKIRRASFREDFENRNCGRFRRIFPCDDGARHAKYCSMLSKAFSLFLAGRGSSMQKEIEVNYNNKLREGEVLDMIAECDLDEQELKAAGSGTRLSRGPKPLQSMPESIPQGVEEDEEEEEEEDGSEEEDDASHKSPHISPSVRSTQSVPSHPSSAQHRSSSRHSAGDFSRPTSASTNRRSPPRPGSYARPKSQTRNDVSNNMSILLPPQIRTAVEENFMAGLAKEREAELTKKALLHLNEMRIKFPGKTDEEADELLDLLNENWKYHKPRIASYWLVKLDSIKRRKVVDIVRSNVKAVLQRVWHVQEVDALRLNRIFTRVFNRLLWSHGQGLWNCFSPSTGFAFWDRSSWETIFVRSSESVSESEMNCCRRIVQLCRDCLLIVYQFAAEAKVCATSSPSTQTSQESVNIPTQNIPGPSRDGRGLVNKPLATFSQRYSKLYQGRTAQIGS